MSEHDEQDDERGPGGMDAIPDEPVEDSEEPGGMSAIPEGEPPVRESQDGED
ncbi:MAG TPA: hypothetical protein VFD90_04615 [Gaiellales bacterium]|jgi:hypothetical protein|nr:hypothetical protein [Gaiellales bacterium]